MPQVLRECRIVFWSKDGEKPFVDVARAPTTGSGQPIPWNCCVRGGWAHVLGVLTWNIRGGGWDKVEGDQPLWFGEELDRYYRTLRLNQAVTNDTFHELGPPPHVQCVKLAMWDEDGEPPRIQRIYSSDKEPIILGKIPGLIKPMMNAGVDGRYGVWEKSLTDWHRQSVWHPTKFEKATWVFIKLVHVGATPQLGRLLTQSEEEGTFDLRTVENPPADLSTGPHASVNEDFVAKEEEGAAIQTTRGSTASATAKHSLKRKRPIGDKAMKIREEGGRLEQVDGEVKPGSSSKPVIDLTIESESDCEAGLMEMSDSESVLSLSDTGM
ncbi:hypothetical protein C8Q70DRAFT_1058439 [Cubamyces menziesii]|nr:hypothetical protein C8Q70DRAFT_1058439 [Cubamyces menziesii]